MSELGGDGTGMRKSSQKGEAVTMRDVATASGFSSATVSIV
jgi:hypothetical protein